MIKLPIEGETHRSLIERAFSQWVPGASVELSTIAPGHSGSSLYKADIRDTNDPVIVSGQYILKLSAQATWADQEDEFTAHNRSYDWNVDFSRHHVPRLIDHYPREAANESPDGYAMLFEIAGGSLDRFTPTATRENSLFYACCDQVLSSILKAWAKPEVEPDVTPDQLVSELCGYRLTKEGAPSLHKLAAELFGNDLHFVVSGDVLINPVRFVDLVRDGGCSASPVFDGLIHGDLHGGNILVHRMQPTEHPFWIVDFALSRRGPIGYDAAYLELSHALAALGDENPALLVGALRSAEDPKDRNPLPDGASWASELIVKMRNTLNAWRNDYHPYRIDEIDRQMTLCRIAAGINWANKPVKESWRKAALCYAGWAARQYLKNHQPALWSKIGLGRLADDSRPPASAADRALWTEMWQATDGFNAASGKYILVAERLDSAFPLRALGQLPWSAVIDLDPASDSSGLYRHAQPLLSARRGVHVFTSAIPTLDLRRGTGWMMASGWAAKSEYFPDYNEWRWERLPIIRDFIRAIAEATSPEALHVIVLPGGTLDPSAPMARLSSIVGTIDEASRGRAHIHLLGGRGVSESAKGLSSIPLTSGRFLDFVADAFGTTFSAHEAQVPGPDGEVRTIPLEVLRTMQENIHVLHSSILDEQPESEGAASEFWRGRPPTWAELHAGLDIERQIHRSLVRTLSEKLDSYRTQTVVLDHSPGAGGTTVALRAAWELRSQYPVAVLHKNSLALGNRVRELFHIAERPVLLVAEVADLTESAREDLYRYFAQNNCRIVLLYLRRSLGQSADDASSLLGPMKKREASSFLTIYTELTGDPKRKEQLKQITTKPSLDRYKYPFFYGLLTFEREFIGIDRYVSSHLGTVRKAARDMLEYLALVTIYSNGGLSIPLIKSMMGMEPRSPLLLDDLLGAEPARLLIARSGGVRFMHQMIAEQVLTHFHGGGPADDWRLDLKAYATDFIRDVTSAAEAEALRTLLRQMFVDRLGGVDGVEDREEFAPIIETLDSIDKTLGHAVLEVLAEECPNESHFWSHLGRHQIYRLRRDYEKAEEYLLRAIKISPTDPLHHHTFGLVLRSRLRHRLQALPKGADVREVFTELDPLFDKAAAEFEETRRLSPENIYGYITHIQMVLVAAHRLKDAAGADTVARVGGDSPAISAWLQENLTAAEQLLREASYLYGTLEQSSQYLTECEADLNKLYGDLDSVVQLWEVANASGTGGPGGRRALANAYLARNDRKWKGLAVAELRRVVDLMESNLRDPGRRDDDYELWFNAFMLLPEYDVDSALSQLALWAKRYPSWRAYYYTYVLHFALWFSRRTDDIGAFDDALEQCRQRHVGRKNRSSLWHGASQSSSGLMSEADLGGWNRELNFFSKPEALRRVNGTIETITGPQAGSILVDGRVRAFFVPGKSFSSHRDENALVNFYLGFSPTGLRAWSVEAGRLSDADRAPYAHAPAGAQALFLPAPMADEPTKKSRADELRNERVLSFAGEFISAKAKIGATLTIGELDERVEAVFGGRGGAARIKIEAIVDALRSDGQFETWTDGSESLVRPSGTSFLEEPVEQLAHSAHLLGQISMFDATRKFGFIRGQDQTNYWFSRDLILPTYRKKISGSGSIVRFVASENEKGPVAHGITVLDDVVLTSDGILQSDQLSASVSEFVMQELDRAASGGIDLAVLLGNLTAAFRSGGPLEGHLNAKSLGAFIGGIEGLRIVGRTPHLKVVRSDELAFGRLPSSRHEPPTEALDAAEVRKRIVALVREGQAAGRQMNLSLLGEWLGREFPGKDTVARRLGYTNLKTLLREFVELAVDASEAGDIRSVEHGPGRVERSSDEIKADIVRLIETADNAGTPLTMVALGTLLKDRYPGERKIHERLEYRRLFDLILDLPNVSVGPAPRHQLRMQSSVAEE